LALKFAFAIDPAPIERPRKQPCYEACTMFDGACIARETGPKYQVAPEADWQRAHRELTRLARTRAAHDYEEARWIVAAIRAKAPKNIGYASIAEHLGRPFG